MEQQVATLTKEVKRLNRMIHMLRKELDNCLRAEDLQCLVPLRPSNSSNSKKRCLLPRAATVYPMFRTKQCPMIGTKRGRCISQDELFSESNGTDSKKRRV